MAPVTYPEGYSGVDPQGVGGWGGGANGNVWPHSHGKEEGARRSMDAGVS